MVDYAKTRKAFGKPIANFGQIQRYIGDGYAKMEAAKALTYNTARSVAPGILFSSLSHTPLSLISSCVGTRNRIGSDAVKVSVLLLFC